MKTYPNLIAKICKTERTSSLVSRSIPILIRWAQSGVTTNTYGDLIKELGMVRFSGIGHTLGCIEDVISVLRKELNEKIPTLNALVRGKDGLPSYGFSHVYADYDSYPTEVKLALVNEENSRAIKYEHWNVILQTLCLNPPVINSKKDEDAIRSGQHPGAGEGPQHKALKEYIFAHPESIGLRNITLKDKEFVLLSGDRLDVYFVQNDGTKIAVEVKSIVSPDDDILRGLYQCVKYKAILDAENKTHGVFGSTRSLLVIEGSLSDSNRQVKDSLGIDVITHFKR